MLVEKEYENVKDPSAMIIKMSMLGDIPEKYHNDITKENKGKEKSEQRVVDIAGKVVGRVPANLCRMLRQLLDEGHVEKILW